MSFICLFNLIYLVWYGYFTNKVRSYKTFYIKTCILIYCQYHLIFLLPFLTHFDLFNWKFTIITTVVYLVITIDQSFVHTLFIFVMVKFLSNLIIAFCLTYHFPYTFPLAFNFSMCIKCAYLVLYHVQTYIKFPCQCYRILFVIFIWSIL